MLLTLAGVLYKHCRLEPRHWPAVLCVSRQVKGRSLHRHTRALARMHTSPSGGKQAEPKPVSTSLISGRRDAHRRQADSTMACGQLGTRRCVAAIGVICSNVQGRHTDVCAPCSSYQCCMCALEQLSVSSAAVWKEDTQTADR